MLLFENVTFVPRTRLVLGDESGTPGMLSRRRGAIVNTSSGSARATAPLLAEYAAAKAYVERWATQAIWRCSADPSETVGLHALRRRGKRQAGRKGQKVC